MAVTFPDAVTYSAASVDTDDPSYSHTVTSGTTLLLVFVGALANEEILGVTWNGNTMTQITLLDESSTASADIELSVWGLLSPTAATGSVAINSNGVLGNWYWSGALNVHGTETSSLGAAINLNSSDLNNVTTTNVSVHAESGTPGNKLLFAGAMMADGSIPVSNDASFNVLLEDNTGGGQAGNNDAGAHIAEKNAPSAITVTWNRTDENVSGLFELFAASASVNTSITVPTGPWR